MGGGLATRVGDWMDLVALNWTVLAMTGSPVALAVINACRLLPAFVLSVPAGVLADRYDRRMLLAGLQSAGMALTFLLAFLLAQGAAFWVLAVVVVVRSSLMTMEPVVRNALLPNIVEPAALSSAIATNSAMLNLSRLVGPAVAGGLLAIWPGWGVFVLSGVLTGLGVLALRGLPAGDRLTSGERPRAAIGEAIAYIRARPMVRSLLILAMVPMVFGFPYTTMMPLFARDLLGLGPEGFGLLLAVSAVGGLVGATWLTIRRELSNVGRWLIGALLAFGVSLVLFIVSGHLLLAGAAIFAVGLASQIYRTMSRLALQYEVPDALRGRVMSIALMDRGLIPLGAMGAGVLAEVAGAWWAGVAMGIGCVAVTLLVAWTRPGLWRD